MATKKTKSLTEVIEKLPANRKAKIEKRTEELINKPSGGWPKIIQGSHSTRTEYEDGRVEFVTDWDALQRDVREAIASVEGKTEEKPKTRKKKNG